MAQYKVYSFDKIPSTQTYAHDMIMRGIAADHTAIVAMAQSAGRGRYRRPWVSHHGNLYVSFIFDSPSRDARLSYAIAVAVAETVMAFGVTPSIKWPNDILINRAKVAGILIEYNGDYVVVGIGINIHSNPSSGISYPTTRLDRYSDASVTDVLSRLMRNIDTWRAADFSAVRTRWMELAVGVGADIIYRDAPAQMVGIDMRGALILRRGDETLAIFGDEISMG